MRSFVALGAISLVGAAALFACGDDSSGDGTAGTSGAGGSAGTAGGAGTAGSAGTAGGGAGGTAGTGGGGGTGGAPAAPASNCTGCVQLTIQLPATPINATNGTSIGYQFGAAATAAPFDLTDVTSITWRVQALTTNANFFVQPYLQNGPPEDAAYNGSYAAISPLTAAAFAPGQWVDVTLNVAALASGGGADAGADAGGDAGDAGGTPITAFDKSVTRAIGLNLGGTATAGAGQVSVEVDSVTVVGTSNFTTKPFTADVEGLTLNNYQNIPGALPTAFH
jgi:hypothetical protein